MHIEHILYVHNVHIKIHVQVHLHMSSQVKFILPTCKTKVGRGGKRRKTLRSPKSAAPSINNLKRIALSGISLDVNKKKRNRNAFTTETT